MSKYFSSTTAFWRSQLDDNTKILLCQKKEKLSKYYRNTIKYSYSIKNDKKYSGTGYVYAIKPQENTLMFIGTESNTAIRICCNVCEPMQWKGQSNNTSLGTYFCISVDGATKEIADEINIYFFSDEFIGNYKSGLEIFNSKGQRIFTSNAKILKLLDFYAEQHGPLVEASKWSGFSIMTEKTYSYDSKSIAFFCGQSCFGGGRESQGSCYFSIFELSRNSLTNKFANDWDTFELDGGGSSGYCGTDFGKNAHWATRVPFTMFAIADVTNI